MKYKQKKPQLKQVEFNDNDFHLRNKIGLDKAYAAESATHIEGDTLYIAGTRNKRDVWDDITKLPFGLTKYANRYKQAKEVLDENPQIKNLVGHSLASSVSDELRKQNPDRELNLKALYGSPFIDLGFTKHDNRYRHKFDPVSFLDRGSKTVDLGLVNPLTAHSYSDY